MGLIVFILIGFYAILIGGFIVGYWRLPKYKPVKQEKQIHFSVLIPFRNEAHNLPYLLKSISSLDYPFQAFEVLFIDDESTDTSLLIIQEFINSHPSLSIRVLPSIRTTGSPKKDALSVGVDLAQNEWILTTDADCILEKTWLLAFNDCIQAYAPKMVVAPVSITSSNRVNFINAYEHLDFLSLMGATIGGFGLGLPFLCNGANLAYEKEAFVAVNGFVNNDHIASGDDHFLLEKFVKAFPKHVRYLNTLEASVTTQPQSHWKALISQRLRWASKTSSYSFWFSKMVGIAVFLANLIAGIFVLALPFVFLGDTAFAKAIPTQFIMFSLITKWVVDFILIAQTASFFDRKKYLKWYPLIMICYPIITVYISIKALTSSYEWKGRRFKQ